MSLKELKMPKMGESISEATIISWLKNVGEEIEEEETLLEVATDKVDTEIPSPCKGVLTKIYFKTNDVVRIGQVIALIEEKDTNQKKEIGSIKISDTNEVNTNTFQTKKQNIHPKKTNSLKQNIYNNFLSPLVISIAQKENLTIEELQNIQGSGIDGRIQKSDLLSYIKRKPYPLPSKPIEQQPSPIIKPTYIPPPINFIEGKDKITEMDRMRKMIADHMVYSKKTSPHVTCYVEVDVTSIVNWRNSIKNKFLEQYAEKLTFTPIFVKAIANAIKEYPMINASLDGKKIIIHKDINIGLATALPSGNLIVPVVKNAEEKQLIELTKTINHLSNSARNNKLKPDEIKGSTFTISNVGTFGSIMGTPIINQPEVAIIAIGLIKKRPEVITTAKGDEIAIRSMMYLSLSFDHRVVDGYLGGSFLNKVKSNLENFDFDSKLD